MQRHLKTSKLVLAACLIPTFCHQAKPVDAQTRDSGAGKSQKIVVTDLARKIHQDSLVVDGHNDLPWAMRTNADSSFDNADISKSQPQFHTDIDRLRQGNVGFQFWSAYVPASTRLRGESAQATLQQIDLVHRMIRRYPDVFEMAATADDVDRIVKSGRIASMIGVEGGHSIENSLQFLRRYYDLGVRYMTLTHSDTLDWADSATDDPKSGGLSPFGEEVVREMNRLGMLVDISHVSEETMQDALRISRAPLIASHSSARTIAPHPRNVPDAILRQLPEHDGVIMVNYYSGFIVKSSSERLMRRSEYKNKLKKQGLDEKEIDRAVVRWGRENPMQPGTIEDVLDHIDHIKKVAGVNHVGIGSDFDGVDMLPEQLEDVSTYPRITQGLLNRGYSEEDVRKILGLNLMRVLRKAEAVAAQMQKEKS